MSFSREKKQAIIDFIIYNITEHSRDIVSITCKKFDVSRQTIIRYLNELENNGVIEKEVDGYKLHSTEYFFDLHPNQDLDEAIIWRDKIAPLLPDIPHNVKDICQHGFTEMLNNAIDHSEFKTILLFLEYNAAYIELSLTDNGIGIFEKIRQFLNLPSSREALIELAKGKLTSAPEEHTGEGIFFTSKMFDDFGIFSQDLSFCINNAGKRYHFQKEGEQEGTSVLMRIARNSQRNIQDVFDSYTYSDDDHSYSKTVIPIHFMESENEQIISRSQGKRLTARFEQFKTVVLDFDNVSMIGQGFADQVFRVFRNSHSEVSIEWINTNDLVANMIKHVLD